GHAAPRAEKSRELLARCALSMLLPGPWAQKHPRHGSNSSDSNRWPADAVAQRRSNKVASGHVRILPATDERGVNGSRAAASAILIGPLVRGPETTPNCARSASRPQARPTLALRCRFVATHRPRSQMDAARRHLLACANRPGTLRPQTPSCEKRRSPAADDGPTSPAASARRAWVG